MKPRNKFIIGTIAALLTFGTLSATVGRHYAHRFAPHEQQENCHRGVDRHDCGSEENQQGQQQ